MSRRRPSSRRPSRSRPRSDEPPRSEKRPDRRPETKLTDDLLPLVATCALGLEGLLEGELARLGVERRERQQGAVTFPGTWKDVWRANWRLRTANRVLVELARFPGRTGDELAAGARAVVEGRLGGPWGGVKAEALFTPDRTLSVRAASRHSRQRDTRWIGVKVKDGVVDAQRDRFGRRSSVERRGPDLPLRLYLEHDEATLLLDTSGESLSHRGYRVATSEAPVREQLAAACVLAALRDGDWSGTGLIVDPMCGSGTLLAEAAFVAQGWPPGKVRGSGWAFEGFPGFDREAFQRIRDEPLTALVEEPAKRVRLFGVDTSRDALGVAKKNLAAAELGHAFSPIQADAFEWKPPEGPGLVLINPPWGERLDENKAQWRRIGDLLKQRYGGWTAVVLAGDPDKGKHVGLKPALRLPVKSGPIDARILVFDLW